MRPQKSEKTPGHLTSLKGEFGQYWLEGLKEKTSSRKTSQETTVQTRVRDNEGPCKGGGTGREEAEPA